VLECTQRNCCVIDIGGQTAEALFTQAFSHN